MHDPTGSRNVSWAGEVHDLQEALDGACDIIAEWVSESEAARSAMRRLFTREGVISARVVKGKEQEGAKYSDYFDWSEPLRRVAAHRLLAMVRAEREGFIKLSVLPDESAAVEQLERIFIKRNPSPVRPLVEAAVRDGYKRLLKPSMEGETLTEAKARADEESIKVFAENLRQLLLAAPLGQKRVLAIDPGFRTGCKVVCLDGQATCCTTRPFSRIRRKSGMRRRCSGLPLWWMSTGSMRWPSGTVRPAAKPSNW